jgi:rubrerythrin
MINNLSRSIPGVDTSLGSNFRMLLEVVAEQIADLEIRLAMSVGVVNICHICGHNIAEQPGNVCNLCKIAVNKKMSEKEEEFVGPPEPHRPPGYWNIP